MALKFEVDILEDVEETLQGLYEEDTETGKFRLSIDGAPSDRSEELQKLQSSIEALETKNREILAEKAKTKKAVEKATEDAARKAGDIDSLEKSWQEKLKVIENEKNEIISTYENTIYKLTVQTAASAMAAKLAVQGSADVLLPHIEKRLKVETKDGEALIRVLGTDGKLSANSLSDLEKEILSTKAFAPILQGPKSSGFGESTGSTRSHGNSKRSTMSIPEKAAFIKENGRDAYLKLPK